ncbi:nuclear transport factor 2 family protein [Dokdonella sp. MW10]|uniref:nuclear transport factor 2 family protein n=1 Tax=Dokdonella sp. MW10 TaxID=2992926 RepID=UPI003F80BD97
MLLVLLAPLANVLASDGDSEKDLLEANSSYERAIVAADTSVLDALYLPEFTYIGPGGVVRDKARQIQSLASGAVDVLEGKSDEVSVRIYGDTAILTGRFTGRARVSDDEFSFHERYSTVWIRRDGVWRLALEHGTVIKDK